MELQVEIISSEMIKPSTPTPKHLSNYTFSLLDQFFQFTYVPHILFYKPPSSNIDSGCTNQMTLISRLKESLSRSLSIFYPLAGRLRIDECAIECNDKGISFVVARALDCSLASFLEATNRVELVAHFISKDTYNDIDRIVISDNNVTTLVLVTIQVTVFECGGVVIGGQYLHKVCDGVTWGNFLKTWALIESEFNEDIAVPYFETGMSLFPPRDGFGQTRPGWRKIRTLIPLNDNEAAAQQVDGLCIVKAFVFTSQAIGALKVKGTSVDVPKPTRIEVVSGFIWKHAMFASSATILGRPSAITHAVNMRPRLHPPLPPTSFGNIFIDTIAQFEGEKPHLQDLVYLIRKSLSMAKNTEFLSKFQEEKGGEILCNYKQKLNELLANKDVTTYKFTSWGGLDMNPDFGFGLPVWTGFTGGRLSLSFKNLIILLETCDGGIEAWMILEEQEMVLLQADEDFLQFATPSDPTVNGIKLTANLTGLRS